MEIISINPVYNIQVNSANATALLETTNLTVSNNVTITTGTFDINSLVLKIGGSITNSGTFNAGDGTIEMNGSDAQTIPAAAFAGNLLRNLTINNTAGVTLDGTLNITGILLASAGSFDTGGYLTLVSTATQTALIDGSGAGDVLGNVTMQRYLASGFGYKYFSSPFQAATVNEFSDDLNLAAAFPSFYRYDENLLSSGWVSYTDTSGVLNPGEGYAANLGASSASKTVDITGVVNNNSIVLPALYNHNKVHTQGFNLVGNPYPSPIDWDAASGWSRTNIDNAVYYFNAGATNQYTGTYSSYINGISSDGTAGNVIAAMQGFFVHVSDGTFPVAASITVNNNVRINNLVPDFRRRSPLTLPLLRLTAGFAGERAVSDAAVVYFDDADATRAFDKEMDALKIMNTDSLVPNLYVIASDTAKLSICAWPGLKDSTDIIPLGLQTKQAGWVTFNTASIERIPYGRHIYLYDAKTGASQDLQSNPRYRVYLDAGNYGNRFFLVFRQKAQVTPAPVNTGLFRIYNTGNKLYARISEVPGEKCQVIVTNMLGQVMMRKQLTGNGIHELGAQFTSGIYIVSFYTLQHVTSKKISIAH
jgi:fibronectin-binding autotransporter adhesin